MGPNVSVSYWLKEQFTGSSILKIPRKIKRRLVGIKYHSILNKNNTSICNNAISEWCVLKMIVCQLVDSMILFRLLQSVFLIVAVLLHFLLQTSNQKNQPIRIVNHGMESKDYQRKELQVLQPRMHFRLEKLN